MEQKKDDVKNGEGDLPSGQRFSPETFDATRSGATFSYGEERTGKSRLDRRYPQFVATSIAAAPTDQAETEAVAVLVCHGMGEQVRFETVGQLASSILSAARAEGCDVHDNAVHLCQLEKGFLARAELSWIGKDGAGHKAHIYEAYWAPVTEDKVTYRDTLQFLFQAAWRGFWCSRFFRKRSFQRWIFGDLRKMSISAWTKVALVLVALILAIQVGIISFVTLKVAAGVKEISGAAWPVLPHWHEMTVASLWGFLWQCFLQVMKPFVPEHAALHRLTFDRTWWNATARTLGWFALIRQAFFVRDFLIQYAGDVAAYISPYKDSKFDAIRTQIQQIGLNVGRVIYGFDPVPGVPHYNRVIVVGHSLGSVLAYDTLNALINTDLTLDNESQRDVAKRTTHLITFGSPLDKTAFLFRTQSNHVKDPLREQMAAGFQPLIVSYDHRKSLQWINIWSPMDVISGSLDYYDFKGAPDYTPIVNEIDPGARIPFAAHVQYWNGRKLATTLLKAIQ